MKRWIGWCVAVCVMVAVMVVSPSPAQAWQAYAKITLSNGTIIAGDSVAKGFEKQIVVLGLGNEIARTIGLDAGGFTPGKLTLGPLRIVKAFDIATPQLVVAASATQALSKVEITLFKTTTTGTSVPGFRITLTNALISSVDTTYDPGATPSALEKVDMVYQKLQWTDLLSGATGSTP